MPSEQTIEQTIEKVLEQTQTIALVGASDKANRPSHEVMAFLQSRDYRVIPVNPRLKGMQLLGETVYGSLEDIPEPIDMVDLFVNVDRVLPLVESAIKIQAKSIWMQLEIVHTEAATLARQEGLDVIMDRCPKIELQERALNCYS